jgi:uncharacterized integral membrane protein (TIGR00697 family)
MTQTDKIYTGLCILFCMLIMLGNLTYQKFVSLNIPFIHSFELSVGAILYPVTFLITDLIAEFFGREKANFCVRFAIMMNIVVVLIIGSMDNLHATSWSKIDDNLFHQAFGFYGIAFIGSIIACYISQKIDIFLYLRIKTLTKGKYLGLRNFLSSSVSLFIDTFIVISFLAAFDILPTTQIWQIMINSYYWKIFFTICAIPLFYFSSFIIKSILNKVD